MSKVETTQVTLPSGLLTLEIEQTLRPLDELLSYAVRRNPKRGFLFVSRVLGKHIPIPPSAAQSVHTSLAAQLPPLTRPHFVALAETATALGEGVWRTWQERHPAVPSAFQHTTRYTLAHEVLLRFDEPHSHAPAHIVYHAGADTLQAPELVLIDDEISTGTTLHNLAAAWLEAGGAAKRVIVVSLTDWCPHHEEIRRDLQRRFGVSVEFVSVLNGRYAFNPNPNWKPPTLPSNADDSAGHTEVTALVPHAGPRLGQTWERDAWLAAASREVSAVLDAGPAEGSAADKNGKVLVLGQGEFQYPAFALAQQLEAAGWNVRWNATTRSPVLVGLAVECALEFPSHMRGGLQYYLYNVRPEAYSHIVVTYEGSATPDAGLMQQLGPHAHAVRLA